MAQKIRHYKITVAVEVDDVTKYEKEFDILWSRMWSELKSIVSNYSRGSGRLTATAELMKDA